MRLLQLLALLLALQAGTGSSQLTVYSRLCKSLFITNRDYVSHKNASLLLQQLRKVVNGCQYVHGDLMIQQLGTDILTGHQLAGDIVSMSSDFLDSIVEVTGRVELNQVGLQRLELRNLRAIRGYNHGASDKFSLQINQCPFMQQLSLPKLVSIASGSVVLRNAISESLFCRLSRSVNFTLLFQSKEQRLQDKLLSFYRESSKIGRSDIRCNTECSASCGRGICWTGASGDCQADSRCTSRSCSSCFTDKATGSEECCDSNCLGGCSSNHPKACFACRSISLNGECVRQCPDGFEYDPGTSKLVSVRPPMVRVGDVCMDSCPAPFVTDLQRRYCLFECPQSQIAISRTCTSCATTGETCVTCQLNERSLTATTVNSSCTILSLKYSSFNVDGTNVNNQTLMKLASVRVIQGDNFLVKRTQTLAFLRNLRYVSGSLTLMDLSSQYIPLAQLQETKQLRLLKLSGLCPKWYPKNFLVTKKRYPVQIESLEFSNSSTCAQAACDPLCVSECWGPGPDLCVACRNITIAGVCYESCQDAGHYELDGKCVACHEACSGGCSGPGPAKCVRCRQFSEDGVCVAACSREMSADSDGNCYSTSQLRLALALGGAGIVLLLMLIVLLLGWWYYNRRMHRYDVVDLDECLADPKNPSDMVQLLVVNNDDIVKEKEIGSGTFGTVFKGSLLAQTASGTRNLPVAIKVLHGKNPMLGQELLSEASLLARVRHQRCIRLVALCMTDEVQLITTLMPRGCLLEFLKSHSRKISAARILSWSLQIAEGMAYLETMGIVHRDLAARNVLLETPDDVKITDFGLAKLLNVSESEVLHTSGLLPVKWLGIECFESGLFSHKSDVWSYGVLLWEICSYGESPYKPYRISSIEDITGILKKGIRLSQPCDCSVDFYNIMLTCWLPQPESRPSFCDLMQMMRDCLLDPDKFIAAGQAARADELDNGSAQIGDIQLRTQNRPAEGEDYAPMSQVEEDSQPLVRRAKPNMYVSDPTEAARQRKAEASSSSPVQTRRQPDDQADGRDEVGYLQPIASGAGRGGQPARSHAPLAESEYLSPRSMVTSQPVDINDDYLAPRNS